MSQLEKDLQEREVTKEMPSQKFFAYCIRNSKIRGKSGRQGYFYLQGDIGDYNYLNTAMLLHAHSAVLHYSLGPEWGPWEFQPESYASLFKEAGIKKIIEIGAFENPIIGSIGQVAGEDAMKDVELTYMDEHYKSRNACNLIEKLKSESKLNVAIIPGKFPEDLPKNEKYDLIVSNGVFTVGGQIKEDYDSTSDIISLTERLSENKSSAVITLSSFRPSIGIDEKLLREKGILLYVNDMPNLYREKGAGASSHWHSSGKVLMDVNIFQNPDRNYRLFTDMVITHKNQ